MTYKATASCSFILLATSMTIGGCQKSESNTPTTPDSPEVNTTDQVSDSDVHFNLEQYLNSDTGIEDAWNLITDEVASQLKSPSSAAYTPIEQMIENGNAEDSPNFQMDYALFRSSFFTGGTGKYDSGIKWIPDKSSYFVIGFVDSQNSYGAMLRTYIAAKIYLENSESAPYSAQSSEDLIWTIQELKIHE